MAGERIVDKKGEAIDHESLEMCDDIETELNEINFKSLEVVKEHILAVVFLCNQIIRLDANLAGFLIQKLNTKVKINGTCVPITVSFTFNYSNNRWEFISLEESEDELE